MAKKFNITNVEVYTPEYGHWSVSCEHNGARFHYWLDANDQSLVPHNDVLYKKPPRGIKREDAGFYRTRHLSISKNQGLVAAMREYALAHDLIAVGMNAVKEKAEREAAEQKAQDRKDTLSDLRKFARRIGENIDDMDDDALMAGLRRIFTEARQARDEESLRLHAAGRTKAGNDIGGI